MLKVVQEFLSDVAVSFRHILSGILLLAGFNVCIAFAALITSVVLGDSTSGITWFFTVMGFHGTGLIESGREVVEVFNWAALGAMFIFAAYSFYSYLASTAQRPRAHVIRMPARHLTSVEELPRAANM